MATRTPGTTTRVIILPARRGSKDCESRNGHRKQFYQIWTDVAAEWPPRWFWCSNTFILLPRPSVTSLSLTCLKKSFVLYHVISLPAEGKVKRWQKYQCSISPLYSKIFLYACASCPLLKLFRVRSCDQNFLSIPDILYQSPKRCFCNVYKSVHSMSQCSCLCGTFNCFHVRNREERLCHKNLFISPALVNGEMSVATCGFEA